MIQVLIAIDNRRVLDEGKYFSFKLKKDLCDLCLHAGFIITDPNLYLCDLDNEDLEMGCLDNIVDNLFRNPPLFDNLECFIVRAVDGFDDEVDDFLELITTIKHDNNEKLKKEPYPIRKSDISRFTSKEHWRNW